MGLPFTMLLVLASAFNLGSESRRTRKHILLTQIRDFPFCRLLRLAGLRWRYSTPPPHGNVAYCLRLETSLIVASYELGGRDRNHLLEEFCFSHPWGQCVYIRVVTWRVYNCHLGNDVFIVPRYTDTWFPGRYLAMDVSSAFDFTNSGIMSQ
jgi:hypothetical protein